ncbi:MAG: TetR/AcrR family transcriptional regulator [Humibacillus sp.]|nr:TetR/AcrR family transcriptional regulator [Humibacillus sp.]MDN5776135.1 TetR/AcrR family transcriptional regulator [Humibacillus sp.]
MDSAGRRIKLDGIDGSGVKTLMADAGLTNGAFYAHFESKDHLVTEVVATQLAAQLERFADIPLGVAGAEELVRLYLTTEHRDSPAQGCPSAALLDEIARAPQATREAYTVGTMAIVDELASRLSTEQQPEQRLRALSLYALLIGTLQLSRALTDRELADDLLTQGAENVLDLIARGLIDNRD